MKILLNSTKVENVSYLNWSAPGYSGPGVQSTSPGVTDAVGITWQVERKPNN